MALPGLFVRFSGVVEVLGGLGLVLPGLLRICPGLTPRRQEDWEDSPSGWPQQPTYG